MRHNVPGTVMLDSLLVSVAIYLASRMKGDAIILWIARMCQMKQTVAILVSFFVMRVNV
jgi:hypothetical protein